MSRGRRWVAAAEVVLAALLVVLGAPVLAHGFDDTIGFVWFAVSGPFYGLW